MTFEIGGVLGSGGIGFVMERYFRGRDVACAAYALAMCAVSLLLFSWTAHWGIVWNCVFMIVAGAGNCGVDPVLSGTLAAKLSNNLGHGQVSASCGVYERELRKSTSMRYT